MARRLAADGYALIGTDTSAEAMRQFESIGGAVPADSPIDVFRHCRRVILSLPTHVEVAAVLESADSVLSADQIVIDTTTGDPASAENAASRLIRTGIHYLDATVSGSSHQLEDGQVTWMVGGNESAYEACRDLFDALGSQRFHVGRAGNGSRMKLVTNLVLGLNRAALAEGLTFAESLQLNLDLTLSVLQGSPAYSRMMDTKGQKMIQGEFSPQARLSQHLKDVQLMKQLATDHGLLLRLTETHMQILQQAVANGLGDSDNSALIEVMRKDDSGR